MNEFDGFLQEIKASPDDDAPRLILADWLEEIGDPRGEYIRLQCELAKLDRRSESAQDLVIREADLLRDHQADWIGSVAQCCSQWTFRRGFVEYVEITAADFEKFGGQLFAEQPVRFAAIHGIRQLDEIAACPHLARLSGLSFGSHWLDTDDLERALASPHFPRLKKLMLVGNHLDDRGVAMLAAASQLDQLELLDLSRNRVHNQGVQAIAQSATLARLQVLILASNEIRLLGARALAESPYLRELRYLDLRHNDIPRRGIDLVRQRFGRSACEV